MIRLAKTVWVFTMIEINCEHFGDHRYHPHNTKPNYIFCVCVCVKVSERFTIHNFRKPVATSRTKLMTIIYFNQYLGCSQIELQTNIKRPTVSIVLQLYNEDLDVCNIFSGMFLRSCQDCYLNLSSCSVYNICDGRILGDRPTHHFIKGIKG